MVMIEHRRYHQCAHCKKNSHSRLHRLRSFN
jgi:ribosomal protein L37AE/L43A